MVRDSKEASTEASRLVEALSDEEEIELFEEAVARGAENPLDVIREYRATVEREDEEFADYVEDLLSRPFVKPEVQEHGIQWLKSKIKIEKFVQSERDATRVIAQYAYRLYLENPTRTDFVLASPRAKVRVRIFEISSAKTEGQAA